MKASQILHPVVKPERVSDKLVAGRGPLLHGHADGSVWGLAIVHGQQQVHFLRFRDPDLDRDGSVHGWYFTKYNTWMQPDPKTDKQAWGKVIWGLLGSLLIIMLIVFVLSIPALSVINPVLPGWADILVAAAAYGIRWLVRRHYGIEGTSLSPDKLTMKKK